MKQDQKQRYQQDPTEEITISAEALALAQQKEDHDKRVQEIDDLLDEIDECLGENAINAQEFVTSFVQKGGE